MVIRLFRRKPEFRRSPNSAKRLKIAVAGLAIIAVVAWWYSYNQTPVTGTIITSNTPEPDEVKTPPNSHFKGTYVVFDYSPVYDTVQSNTPSGRMVEQYSLSAAGESLESRRISITINKIAGAVTIQEDSAYRLRANAPETYRLETVTVNELSVEKFSKKDGAEVTYFIPGGEYYAIVSATSTRSGGEFINDAAIIVSSLVWQK